MIRLFLSYSPNTRETEAVEGLRPAVPPLRAFQELAVFSAFMAIYFFMQWIALTKVFLSPSGILVVPSVMLLIMSALYSFSEFSLTSFNQREFRATVLLAPVLAFPAMLFVGTFADLPNVGYYSFFSLVLLVPIAEEAFFRGILLDHLIRYNGRLMAVVLSTLLFALLHFSQGAFVQMLALGLVLGVITAKTRRLAWAILGHALWNYAALML